MTMSNDLVLTEAGLRQVTCIVRERQRRLHVVLSMWHVVLLPAGNSAIGFFYVKGAPTRFMVASG